MRIITLEEHFTTPAYLEATAHLNNPAAVNDHQRTIQQKQADLGDGRIADMDAAGIDVQFLSLSGILLDSLNASMATEIARDANDAAARAMRAYPGRFGAFAALGLKEPQEAAGELRRCVGELGFQGAMVNGTTDGLFLDHPRFSPVLEAARELNVPVYVHPAPPPSSVRDAYYSDLPNGYGQILSIAGWGWHAETGLHALRLLVSGVFERLPGLQIIIGHMGENLPFFLARAEAVLSNAPTPLPQPLSEMFRAHFHITTSGFFTLPPFQCAQTVLGIDRILFSVDYPFSTNVQGRQYLDSLPLSAEDREKVSHGNAERLLRL